MERRREERISVDLQVQIQGNDADSHPFSQTASVRTISGRGATLQGVSVELKTGDVVNLEYRNTRAQFRVAWQGKPGTELQGKVGVENLSPDVLLWDGA